MEMANTPETHPAGKKGFKETLKSWRLVPIKRSSKSDSPGLAVPQRVNSSELNDGTELVTPATSSEAPVASPENIAEAMKPEQLKSENHVGDKQKNQAPGSVVNTPEQVSGLQSKTSLASPKAIEAAPQPPGAVFPSVPKMLWNNAYEAVRGECQGVVDWYETILSLDLDKASSNLSPHAPISDWPENLISQDAQARGTQMEKILSAWLNEESAAVKEPSQQQVGQATQRIPSPRDVLRKVIEVTPTEASLVWVGACYVSKILLHPTTDNKGDCEGLIYIISRMEWYNRLPKLLGKEVMDGINDHRDLSSRITKLYAAILGYVMKMVCFHFGSPALELSSNVLQVQLESITLTAVKNEERNLALFNEDWVKVPLERLLDDAKEMTKSTNETNQKSDKKDEESQLEEDEELQSEEDEWSSEASNESDVSTEDKEQLLKNDKQLLDDLHVGKTRPAILDLHGEQSEAIRECYQLLARTEQYKEFLQWDELDHRQLLWISGGSGHDRTMLLVSAAQTLSGPENTTPGSRNLSFFFSDYSLPEYGSATAALKNLIWCLLNQHPLLVRHLRNRRDMTDRDYLDNPNDFFALSGIFYDIVVDEKFTKTYVVVDALEECSFDREQPDVGDFVDLITQSMKLSKKIKWLVSSDNSKRMTMVLEKWKSPYLDLSADLLSFSTTINNNFCRTVPDLAINNAYIEELKTTVADALCKKSLDDYLWIETVCTSLRAEEVWRAKEFLEDVGSIQDLRSLYCHMEGKIRGLSKNAEHCIEVLQTMTFLHQPSVSVEELKHLVPLPPNVDMMALLQKCSAFLRVRDTVVSFWHQSAKGHMKECLFGDVPAMRFHEKLARRCLNCLTVSFGKGYIQDAHIVRTNGEHPKSKPKCNYASLHWMTHLHEISKTLDDTNLEQGSHFGLISEVEEFMKEHFLPWVDTLISEKQLSIAAIRLRKVDLWLREKLSSRNILHGTTEQMSAQISSWKALHGAIRDAHLFLHLYQRTSSLTGLAASNTLIFCPMQSIIREFWMPKAFPWLTGPPKMDQYWTHEFAVFKGHSDWIRTVAFSPDGRFIASGSDDSTVRIWDAETGTTQHSLKTEGKWVYCITFSSQGIVAAGSDDYCVKLWEASTGRELAHLGSHKDIPTAVSFSPDGTQLAVVSSWGMWLWETQSGNFRDWESEVVFKAEQDDAMRSVAFSPDGALLATGVEDGKICIWDVKTRKLRWTLEEHLSMVVSITFSRDGKLLASGAYDGTAGIWDARNMDLESEDDVENLDGRRPLRTIVTHTGELTSIAFSPDFQGSRLATATDNAIHIWDTKTGNVLQTLRAPSFNIRSVTFAPNGAYLASGSYDTDVHLWYASSESQSTTSTATANQPSVQDAVEAISLSPDGCTIAAGLSGGSVSLWDMKTGDKIERDMHFGHKESVYSLAFSPSGELLLSGSSDGTMRLCKATTGELLHIFDGHDDWVRCVAWSPCEKYVASASDDGSVLVWGIGGRQLGKLRRSYESYFVLCAAFSHDGKYIVSGDLNARILVWEKNEEVWQEKMAYTGHDGSVVNVMVTRDSKRVISTSTDETVRIWDIETGSETQPPIKLVDWYLYPMWFPPFSTEYIMTSHGALYLNSSSASSPSPSFGPWRIRYDFDEGQWWITFQDQDVIFLPEIFEPTSACVLEDKVVIGTSLGNIHVYGFSEDCVPKISTS